VAVRRGSESVTLTAQIVEQPESVARNGASPANGAPQANDDQGILAGVHVMEIPPDHEEDLPPHAHGVMVSDVDDNSPASGSLQQSDVIEEIDHVPIHSVPEYQQAAAAITGQQQVLLSICRDRRRSFAVVTAQ